MTGEGGPVYTVGHSTRSADEFRGLLEAHGVDLLVDVRRHPGSRRHPHFNQGELSELLEHAGIRYRHEEALGGRRGDPDPEGPNDGWRSDGFRAYADHLNTPEGREALARVEEDAAAAVPALMCAEAVPWRCHRQIAADHLVAAGLEVRHILDAQRAEPHELRDMARVLEDGRVVYPAEQRGLFEEGDVP